LLLGILVLFYFLKKWTFDRRRTKQRQQQMQEHTHGFHLWKNRLGLHRFVKSVNQLPSNKPRRYPLNVRFAPTVGVKFIPPRNHPINKDAWNLEYHRQVAVNNRWQQEQWSLETQGKYKHRRLVVSSIAMMEFRRTVLSTLVDHAQTMQTRWMFRRSVAPSLIDLSHRLRWKWALQRHHAKAPFQETVLSALPGHHKRLWLDWNAKKSFSQTVLSALADHFMQLRFKWALQEAERQLAEMDIDFDDLSNSSSNDDYEDEDVRNALAPIATTTAAAATAATTTATTAGATTTTATTTTRPQKQRPTGNAPTSTTRGATVWLEGRRRSARLQPLLGSFFVNGKRRSARLI
jgi:hypothetical protein